MENRRRIAVDVIEGEQNLVWMVGDCRVAWFSLRRDAVSVHTAHDYRCAYSAREREKGTIFRLLFFKFFEWFLRRGIFSFCSISCATRALWGGGKKEQDVADCRSSHGTLPITVSGHFSLFFCIAWHLNRSRLISVFAFPIWPLELLFQGVPCIRGYKKGTIILWMHRNPAWNLDLIEI